MQIIQVRLFKFDVQSMHNSELFAANIHFCYQIGQRMSLVS